MARSRRSAARARRPVGFTRQPRVMDKMTPEYYRLLSDSLVAERSGDASTAQQLHHRIPMFTRSAHQVWLTQLAGLATEMTPWMWARWAAYQATRADGESRTATAQRRALRHVVEACYQDRIDETFHEAGDPIQVTSRVLGESWAFHHMCAFDCGGLEAFLDEHATGRMLIESDTARRWVGTPMGGYRLEAGPPGSLTVTDLRSGHEISLLPLGAQTHAGAGGWLLGRVVPSGTSPELMFDNRPLAVDEDTARRTAADDAPGAWLDVLCAALDKGRVDRSLVDSEDREMVTDVLSLSLLERGTSPQALAATMRQLGEGRDEVGRAAYRILRDVAAGSFGPDGDAAYVGAAVLNAHAYPQAWRGLAADAPAEHWLRWSELVPEPARGRLRRLGGLSWAE